MNCKRPPSSLFIVICLITFAVSPPAIGQEPFFIELPVGDGINDATLQAFYQDRQGFFWLGTSKGLYRFDGTSYMQVSASDSMKNESYTAIFEDSGATIWAGTGNGKILTIRQGKPELFNPGKMRPAVWISGMVQDSGGGIWFSTYGEGIWCWSGNQMYNLDIDDGLGDNYTYCIIDDHKGSVWVGTDGGISICSLVNGKKQIETLNETHGLPDNIVQSLATSAGDIVWAGMHDGGICKIDRRTRKVELIPAATDSATGPVNDLLTDGTRLWIASESRGLLSIDMAPPFACRQVKTSKGKPNDRLEKILLDDQENIWLLTDNALVRTTGDKIEFLYSETNPAFSNIKSVISGRNGEVWFSNDRGLYRYRPGNHENQGPVQFISDHTYPGLHIISLYEDHNGFIWAGTFGSGLFRLDPATRAISRYTERDGLANNNVFSITGVENEVWFATLGGASRCLLPGAGNSGTAKPSFENFGAKSGLGNNFIYSVFADSKKRLWFATDGKGITAYEAGRFRNFSEEAGVSSKIVYSITQEENGHIWFSSSHAGLFHYNGDSINNFSQKDGLSDLAITGLSAAASPVIFIVHPGGIDVLEPLAEKFSYLGAEVGLGDINSSLNAVAADRFNDLIWVGTDKSLIKLSASAFVKPYRPLIWLNGVKVFLAETDTLEPHNFAFNRNHFSFDYIGLWYQAPGRVQYQVMLEGYDLDWIPTRNTSVIYSSLGPGEYTFRVRASLNSNFTGAPAASYHFVIRKPIWKTYWFVALTIILAGSIVYLLVRSRERRLMREEKLQKEKLLFQLQTLKNQVNPHFLFNSFSTLSAVIDEDKEMALDYVQKLSVFFRNILEYRDKSIITLREELSLADTYYYLQKKRYGANFNLVTEVSEEFLGTLIPPMTLQMIIENAVKHNIISADKPLTVKVSISGGMIVITNKIQVKKNIPLSTGVGLQNIRNRYRLLVSREIEVTDTDGVFTVCLPVINSIPT